MLSHLKDLPVIGVCRGCPLHHVERIAKAAGGAGLMAMEVTLDSEQALRQIELVRRALPDLLVGAGTVLTGEDVDAVARLGVDFVVSPVVESSVLERGAHWELTCIPGAASPTEIWRAHRSGATAVKVFPAEQLGGPSYLEALRGPLPDIPLVPTGGIDSHNARAYLDSGAAAVGIGSAIFAPDALRDGDAERINMLASSLIASLS